MDLPWAAISYATSGHLVFPLWPRTKKPATSHGLHDATRDPTRIERWWRRHPDHNIGVATGATFDVLDVDDPAADRALHDTWRAAGGPEGFLDGPGSFGPATRTASGWHFLVAATGIGNRTKFLPGCDWRGQGGYIVAPPSIHPDGPRYRWVDGHDPDQPLPTCPTWLLETLQHPAPVSPPPATNGHQRAAATSYARRALESEIGRVLMAANGTRNDQLNRSAHALGQLVAGGALDATVATEALYQAGLRVGLEPREVSATIRSGLTSGARTPRRAPS